MNNVVREALISWAEIHELVKDNPRLLIENYEANSKRCTDLMILLGRMEAELYRLRVLPDVPEEYHRWLRARYDQACGDCWRSSIKQKDDHPECQVKLKEYFESDDSLSEYAKNLKGCSKT